MQDTIHTRYRELACCSIAQGINDWLQKKDATDYELYKWLMECDWFDFLNLDREWFYVKILDMKAKGIRRVRYKDYGKTYDI